MPEGRGEREILQFTEHNQQDATFHNVFISVRHSTSLRRVFRPLTTSSRMFLQRLQTLRKSQKNQLFCKEFTNSLLRQIAQLFLVSVQIYLIHIGKTFFSLRYKLVLSFHLSVCRFSSHIPINLLTPNDLYMSRTAPLTSKLRILYMYSTNVGTEYFKHALYSPFFFLFKMQFVS